MPIIHLLCLSLIRLGRIAFFRGQLELQWNQVPLWSRSVNPGERLPADWTVATGPFPRVGSLFLAEFESVDNTFVTEEVP